MPSYSAYCPHACHPPHFKCEDVSGEDTRVVTVNERKLHQAFTWVQSRLSNCWEADFECFTTTDFWRLHFIYVTFQVKSDALLFSAKITTDQNILVYSLIKLKLNTNKISWNANIIYNYLFVYIFKFLHQTKHRIIGNLEIE